MTVLSLWFFYNAATNQCECYNRIPNFNGPDPTAIKCIGQRALIYYNDYIMTYSNEELLVGQSLFFQIDAYTGYSSLVDKRDFIELPSNITELNDYMCGPANRKGSLCSECIDGFGPSATSSEVMCSNCTTTFAIGITVC